MLTPPYTFKIGKARDVTRFPLPPSYLLRESMQFCAVWLLADGPDDLPEYTVGSNAEFYIERPDLRYSYADWQAACKVEDDVITLIMMQHHGRFKAGRELAVIGSLRKAGLSREAIATVFKEQAIGDPYRPTGSLIGSMTLADELLHDLYAHRNEDAFAWAGDKHTFWFNLVSAVQWWYTYRRQNGLRILPEKELRALIAANPGGFWLKRRQARVHNGVKYWMFGADVELARNLGVIRDE